MRKDSFLAGLISSIRKLHNKLMPEAADCRPLRLCGAARQGSFGSEPIPEDTLTLSRLSPGSEGRVLSLSADGPLRRRMLDLGLVPGAKIRALQRSPAGDPTAYLICGAVIALRSADAQKVTVAACI